MTELIIVIGMSQEELQQQADEHNQTIAEFVATLPDDRVQRFPVPEPESTE